MILHLKEAKHIRDYTIWLRFSDGAEGEVDLGAELDGEVFESLKNIDEFRKFKVDPDLQTIVWDNGADMAPEFLYDRMAVIA
jgi:hypothetical protein